MRRVPVRAAVIAALLLPAGLGAAPRPGQAPESRPIPAEPAPAPPAPARLAPGPQPAQPVPAVPEPRPFPLPPGLEALPGGAWRLRFAAGTEAPPRSADAALEALGARLATLPEGRVTLLAQASGPASDVSTARRLSLARGLAVKEALVAGGLPATRIDLRPMGRTEEATDVVDVQPPAAR
ncbi:OmpA family protein [Roseicella aquatilis]|uniref:hypothetical protein n=1 Tax=Roseicella aquatilis TaxID=2527868 RepID=UPI0010533F4A|nr:hypothetical protein [Roseicella aquatilis]